MTKEKKIFDIDSFTLFTSVNPQTEVDEGVEVLRAEALREFCPRRNRAPREVKYLHFRADERKKALCRIDRHGNAKRVAVVADTAKEIKSALVSVALGEVMEVLRHGDELTVLEVLDGEEIVERFYLK